MRKNTSGFTIVELLVVIVVIAILAAITIVAFNGVQERARDSSLQVDLSNALKQVILQASDETSRLTSLPSTIKTSNGNILHLTYGENNEYCINGYGANNQVASISNERSIKNYLCSGALVGTPVGGSVPAVPKDVNLVADFSTWQITGALTYNASSGQLCVGTSSGNAVSPLIRVEGSTSARFAVEAYATQPSPSGTPQSRGYYGALYYGDDGVTSAYNTSNYTSNGNAQNIPLSTWTSHLWGPPTGTDVKYIRFRVYSSPESYTSNNCYRNPRVTITKP